MLFYRLFYWLLAYLPGYHKKIPQLGSIENRNLFNLLLETGRTMIKGSQWGLFSRLADSSLLAAPSQGGKERGGAGDLSLLIRFFGIRSPSLLTGPLLPPRDPVSRFSHRGWRASTYEFSREWGVTQFRL